MPRKFELTFQRGAEGRVGRWKKFYRGKAYYLGSGRGKSDVTSYREAVAAWGALKVKLDAEIVSLPRAHDAEYDEVIREWELVLSWSVQHGADEEAVVAREMLGELRERREKPRQPPVTHSDRLWSRFRPEQKVLQELADLASASGSNDMEQFRFEMLKRRGKITISEKSSTLGEVSSSQRAEIQWQDRLANQSQVTAAEETHSLGGWVMMFLAKEQQRVGAGDLSAGRFTSMKASVFYFRNWAGAQVDVSTIAGQTLTRYHSHLLELMAADRCSATYARDRLVAVKTLIRWLWGQDAIEKLPKNIDSKELKITRRTTTPETMTHAEVAIMLRETTGLNQLCILLGLNCGMTQKDISDLLDTDVSWQAGTITRKRSKTANHAGVPTVTYQLWPETFRLLQQHRSQTEVVLLTKAGKRLVEERLDENGSYRKSDSVKSAYDRGMAKLPFAKPFKLLRKTSATMIHANPQFRGLDPLFLGHAPASIAERHYVATSRSALDEALEWLRAEYRVEESFQSVSME